jgi:hypothetical protein
MLPPRGEAVSNVARVSAAHPGIELYNLTDPCERDRELDELPMLASRRCRLHDHRICQTTVLLEKSGYKLYT